MFQQVHDFQEESQALHDVLKGLTAAQFSTPTLFKEWTFDDVIGHLNFWNWAADLSLNDEPALMTMMTEAGTAIVENGIRPFENAYYEKMTGVRNTGPGLLELWHDYLEAMTRRFAKADPKARVRWAGPDMSVRSSISARLMETWAHGQAVYDALGIERVDTDRIKSIVILGVNTYTWPFKLRKLTVPGPMPNLCLTAPSGEFWTWGEPDTEDRIEGSATSFCQVVTQVRNVADTDLVLKGDVARQWMDIVQCFAGNPVDPPAPGTRFKR